LSLVQDNVEKSIHVYTIETNLSFNEIKDSINYVLRVPFVERLLQTEMTDQYLFMSQAGFDTHQGIGFVWVKFGWARRSGLPETINTRTGGIEYLRLGSDTYLFEPAHFLIFEYSDKLVLLHEVSMFAPRPNRLCYYVAEFYKKMKGDPNLKVKMVIHRLLRADIENLLKEYNVIKSLRIEAEAEQFDKALQKLSKQNSIVSFLDIFARLNPGKLSILIKAFPGEGLNMPIQDLIALFHETEEHIDSFVIEVKKGVRTIKIDLKKAILIFRKYIKLARDSEGNLLRVTDTNDAINALKGTISDVVSQLRTEPSK
jgi:hypothetical protein